MEVLKYMDKTTESQKAALDRFLADNPDLEKLSDRLATFNIFRTLRIEKAEIRHSNVLAWLLNPEESHGLGNIVLRRVLSNILLQADARIKGISAAKVELIDFVDIDIRREWRNIDLLIIDRTNRLLLLIENKIYSGESPGQLLKYQEAVEKEFPSYILVPVFLTLTGEESRDSKTSNYISYSHLQLLTVIEKIFSQRQSQLSEQVAVFIRQYMDVLRRLTMQDESLVELCKTIYRRHREAINLVVEYGMVGVGQQVVEDILSEKEEYEILYSRPTSVWFLPKSWAAIIPENGTAWTHLKRKVSVACWIEFYKDKAHIHFELSAMNPPELRTTSLKKLKKAEFRVADWAFEPDKKYSRFFGRSLKVSDMTDYEEVRKVVDKLLRSAKTEFPKAEEIFRDVFKNLKVG